MGDSNFHSAGLPPKTPLKRSRGREWLRTLIAILGGNLLYFSLERYLPAGGRHQPFHFDVGMLVDLWVCILLYVLIGYLPRFRRSRTSSRHLL